MTRVINGLRFKRCEVRFYRLLRVRSFGGFTTTLPGCAATGGHPNQYDVTDGRNLTVVEHRLRFARRDPRTQELVVTTETRWVRLRISNSGNECVATWAFRPDTALDR